MLSLKGYLNEMTDAKIKDLDAEFIARATKITSFNLRGADFESLAHKAEIQHIIHTHWFPKFRLGDTMKGLNMGKLNSAIDTLKKIDRFYFDKLYDWQPKGVGPGEVLLYFLIDDAVLGGGSSAGVDVKIGGKNYEVKAANLTGDKKAVYGFRLGGTVNVSQEVRKAIQMKEELGFTTKGKGQGEVNKTQIEAIKKKYPKEWESIRKSYVDKAYKYFAGQNVIFFNNNRGTGGKLTTAAGNIAAVKTVSKNDIEIDVITQNSIKPRVKI